MNIHVLIFSKKSIVPNPQISLTKDRILGERNFTKVIPPLYENPGSLERSAGRRMTHYQENLCI